MLEIMIAVAGGIVLAVIILRFWQEFLGLALILLGLALILIVLAALASPFLFGWGFVEDALYAVGDLIESHPVISLILLLLVMGTYLIVAMIQDGKL